MTCRPSPPLAWYIQISPAPSERSFTKWRRTKMYWLSGDQAGLLTNQRFSLLTWRAPLPSRAITQMFHSPSRSLVNAIDLPSGLKRGCMSKAGAARQAFGQPAAAARRRA